MAHINIRLNFNGGLVLKEILKYAHENQFSSNYEHVCNFYENEREQQKLKREKIEERLKNFKIHQDLR